MLNEYEVDLETDTVRILIPPTVFRKKKTHASSWCRISHLDLARAQEFPGCWRACWAARHAPGVIFGATFRQGEHSGTITLLRWLARVETGDRITVMPKDKDQLNCTRGNWVKGRQGRQGGADVRPAELHPSDTPGVFFCGDQDYRPWVAVVKDADGNDVRLGRYACRENAERAVRWHSEDAAYEKRFELTGGGR